MRPMVKAMLTHPYPYAYGAVSPVDGRGDSRVLPHVNSECLPWFITEIGRRYPDDNIIMVGDGAGWHQRKSCAVPENWRRHFLPPYSPALHPQEHLWDERREQHFHNQVFDRMAALEDQLVEGLRRLEAQPQIVRSMAAWDWIFNSVSNAN